MLDRPLYLFRAEGVLQAFCRSTIQTTLQSDRAARAFVVRYVTVYRLCNPASAAGREDRKFKCGHSARFLENYRVIRAPGKR